MSLEVSKANTKENLSIHDKRKSRPKNTITPLEKLTRRIHKEFPLKKFIGDILIDDDEYLILIGYLRNAFNRLVNSYNNVINDPVFATALVQVGIRNYDGNYWGHLSKILKPHKVNVNHQKWISESFYLTLKMYNKLLLQKNERISNILMHGFVADHYAYEFFDFLFAYYRIDLERDLSRNNLEMMNSLIEIIMRNDNTDRTYLLVKHTQDAVTNNIRGCKIRIRRFLRLIDSTFWGQEVKLNLNNRLSRLFNQWSSQSKEFNDEKSKFNSCGVTVKGKKKYTSPYIKCDLKNAIFKLVLPTQLIKATDTRSICWKIRIEEDYTKNNVGVYRAVTGFKTEELMILLERKDLFKAITIELMEGENRLRLFKINKDIIRFFDRDGDLIIRNNLQEGEVYSFNEDGYTPISDALIDSEVIDRLVRAYFEFEKGDIVRLPDGTPVSIGNKIEEGLLHRGYVPNVLAEYDFDFYKIYRKPPTVLLKIPERKANGTMINVNGNKIRMFDVKTTKLDLKDRSGETGFLINLSDIGCVNDGLYNVYIDVPNDRTSRIWQFILINGITFEFEGAPYIFENKATIKFNEGLKIKPKGNGVRKIINENSYNFEITSDDEIVFETVLSNMNCNLRFEIPVLKWSFDNENWFIEKPLDIWHYDFPTKIFIKVPENKLVLRMDDLLESDIEQSVSYTKKQGLEMFECDVTRFRSWFSREKKIRTIFMKIANKEFEFINVITRSYVTDKLLLGDFANEKLIGEFEIVGNSNYYVDIVFGGRLIAEKELIKDGKIVVSSYLASGRYKIIIYEEEDDDTGFGDKQYLHMHEFYQDLINPYDLTGKKVKIKFIKKNNSMFKMGLIENHTVHYLELIDSNDRHKYKGMLKKKLDWKNEEAYPVMIEFSDLDNLKIAYISFADGDEYIELLYDEFKMGIVRYEENGLSPSVRYRRYTVIYKEDYLFGIEFN